MVLKALKKTMLIASAAAVALAPMPATAITVQPVVLNLSPGGTTMSQVITVTNTFAYPIALELRVEELGFDATGIKSTGRDPGDLVVFPPTALVQPGQTQTFRVQYVGDGTLARSKHYFVTVAQLPVKTQQGQTAVQVLYNFQVLVSVAPTRGKPQITVSAAQVEKTGDGKAVPTVTFTNPSNTHGYLADGRIRVVEKDAAGKEVFRREYSAPEVQQAIGYGLIGAGQTRRVTLPVELPSASGSVEVQYTPAS